ncbi:MAG: AtpZ/AtpI family protein [Lachnospiraceae bacterium]|nr:AtpZ/AtpI family protein [Lachnospiraceae bacterium]
MKNRHTILKMISLITQLGITMLTSIFLCMFIGLWIDRKFSTHFFIPFLLLGIAGGFRGVYTLVVNANKDEKESDDDQEEIKEHE